MYQGTYPNNLTRRKGKLAHGQDHAVDPDMQSHGDIIMILVKGAAYSESCKQKINTKSSIEAEQLASDDYMAQVLWTRNFRAAQVIHVPMTTIYHDREWKDH